MKDIDRIIAIVSEALAKAAELCASNLDASGSTISGAQALRKFAATIRETNAETEQKNATVH
jgi:hypothetical protein